MCPECGKTQPPDRSQYVRADRVCLAIAIGGVALFGLLASLSMGLGISLGAEYTGNVELVRYTVTLAGFMGLYAIGAFGVFTRRSRLRCVRVETRRLVGCLLILPAACLFGFVVLIVMAAAL